MPVLTVPLTPDGALVDILVGLSRPQVRRLRNAGRPVPASIALRALLDTGAECTCVDPQAVVSLSLPIKGYSLANLPAASGVTPTTQHDAGLTILHPAGPGSSLVIPELLIAELALHVLGYQAVIGRDVLAGRLLVYDGSAHVVTLAY